MLEAILGLLLYSAIPDICFLPAGIGMAAFIQEIDEDVKAEEALRAECEIYIKDYTDCHPEWFWGNHDGKLNFQELIALSPEKIMSDYIIEGLKKLPAGQKVPTDDYTLALYFRENMCVRIEYCRPMDRQFLACYGYGDKTSFHVYSELLGSRGPLDMKISYLNFLNVVCAGKNAQMFITVTPCGDVFPNITTLRCNVSKF